MVFPSVPVYLDPPSWNQDAQQPGSSRGGAEVSQFQRGAAPRPEGGMGAPVQPGSMADRARLAKYPQPEQALKCPRCDSTNTKFCYFNNYSLTQPRHFCKTCRRYWTRGGALRNVPVGGGCRRNKRSKSTSSSSSKSQITAAADRQSAASSSSSTATSIVPPTPQLPFMPSLYPLADYGLPNIGLNFAGIQSNDAVDHYQVGGSSSTGMEQWRFQQIQPFPFFGGLEVPAPAPEAGLYPFDGEDVAGFPGQVQMKASTAGLITQMASVKMEDNTLGINLARQYLGVRRSDQYWGGGGGGGSSNDGNSGGGGGWMMDLSGFNSSSSSNLL